MDIDPYALRQIGLRSVDYPTQLICIWISICQHTMTKDTAELSARLGLDISECCVMMVVYEVNQILEKKKQARSKIASWNS